MRLILLAIGMWAVAVSIATADPLLGRWKFNDAKSDRKMGPVIATYTKDGDWEVTKIEGQDARGEKFTRTIRYKIDGNEYPFPTPSGPAKLAFRRIDEYNLLAVGKLDSGDTLTVLTTVSKDGKTRTVKGTRTNSKGEQVTEVVVYERE